MTYFCKKTKRERDKGKGWLTNIAQNLGWFGGSVPFKGWDHLTDPQICLDLKIVDEYLPWTVSSLKINGWKIKSPFGMAYFQGWTLRFRSVMLSPFGALFSFHWQRKQPRSHILWSRSRWSSGCVDYGWGFSISRPWCDWKLQLTGSKFLHSQETCAQTLYPLNSSVNTSVNLGLVARGSHLHTTTSEIASE